MKAAVTAFFAMATIGVCGLASSSAQTSNDDKTSAVLAKGMSALGGADKLNSVKAASWKATGTINFGGNENSFKSAYTVQGLDQFRSEFEGDFGGNQIKGVTVLNGDKGWRKFGDMVMEMDKDAVTNEKRTVYLQVVPTIIVPLKGKAFKVEMAGMEKVDNKPAAVLKITGPEGKDFKLYFDQETGLPVKQVAKVVGFMGEEFTQETTYSNFK